jgi:putative hydrolase of the HAD superfamily
MPKRLPLQICLQDRCDPMKTARQALMFDWGGTLMRDFPEYRGPMVDWPEIACLPAARETLAALHADWIIALATNAADSNEDQIWAALARGSLKPFIDMVFCYRRLGVKKPEPAYFQAALQQLDLPPAAGVMVGDDFGVDITGALRSGLRAVWLNEESGEDRHGPGYTTIHSLVELPDALIGLSK